MKKEISIIIPIYNSEDYIIRCLNSIINQTFTNYEIIIVDDGSTDKSLELCNIFKKKHKDKCIKVISQQNSGPSCARNNGLNISNGNFVTFIDADDYLSENALENMINNIEEDTLIKINYQTFKESKINYTEKLDGIIDKKIYIDKIFNQQYPGSVWGSLFEKRKLDNIRFDNKLYFLEDTLFLTEYLNKIEKIKFVEGTYFYRLDNKNSITVSNKKIVQNIVSFCTALDKIDIVLKNKYSKEINQKKIQLIEKEIAKINNYDSLKTILLNKDFIKKIDNINKQSIDKLLYKVMFYLYKNRKSNILFIYINIRKIIKSLKYIRR